MNPIATKALASLWARADRADMKASSRPLRLHMSLSGFPDYAQLPTVEEKERFHAEMREAARAGAISIAWEKRAGSDGQIAYIELSRFDQLSALLERCPTKDKLAYAVDRLQAWSQELPNVGRLLNAWTELRAPRGITVDSIDEVVDACRLIEECAKRHFADVSVRRASTSLFGDSKRIEMLGAALDLITADTFDQAEARHPAAVFASLGLLQHPQPVLVAGQVVILTGRDAAGASSRTPAFPYSGFAPQYVYGADGTPAYFLSVENLTTFNELSSEMAGPLAGAVIYTGGFASPSMLRAYQTLVAALPPTTPLYHWGDTDLGGFRIARQLAEACVSIGRRLQLWMMGEYPDDLVSRALSAREQAYIQAICQACGWDAAGEKVARVGHAIEQEQQDLRLPPF